MHGGGRAQTKAWEREIDGTTRGGGEPKTNKKTLQEFAHTVHEQRLSFYQNVSPGMMMMMMMIISSSSSSSRGKQKIKAQAIKQDEIR